MGMATELRLHAYAGGLAGEDFSSAGSLTGQGGGQYLIVTLSAKDTFVHYQNNYALTGIRPMGVSQNNPKNAGELSVMMLGRTKLTAGSGGLAVGDEVGSDSAGRGVKKRPSMTGANLGDWVIGVCVEAAAAGEVASVEMVGAYQV